MKPRPPITQNEVLYYLLQKQLGYYRLLLQLVLEKKQLLDSPAEESLRMLTKRKRSLLFRIHQLDGAIAAIKKSSATTTQPIEQLLAEQIHSVCRQIDEIIQTILSLDSA